MGKWAGKEIKEILNYANNIAGSIFRKWGNRIGIFKFESLEEVIAKAEKETGEKKVNLIGHSFGGLQSFAYALENPEKICSCMTIGTPYNGTSSAYLGALMLPFGILPEAALQITPGNDFVKMLRCYFMEHGDDIAKIRFINFFSVDDELVPGENALLKAMAPEGANVEEYVLTGEGHGSQVYCEKVHERIVSLINETELPTIFVHGFAMDKHFFGKTLKKIKKEHPDILKKHRNHIYHVPYDTTKRIEAKIIAHWYNNRGRTKIIDKNLPDY